MMLPGTVVFIMEIPKVEIHKAYNTYTFMSVDGTEFPFKYLLIPF